MSYRLRPKRFLVAFSFAGEQRDLVRAIATNVERILGDSTVFFDEWFEPEIAGSDADLRLQRIYRDEAALVIPCVSKPYEIKPWTKAEQRAIRNLQFQIDHSSVEQEQNRLLPLRVGDGEVEGITFDTTIAIDVRDRRPEDTAELIVARLRETRRVVYLACCWRDQKISHDTKRLIEFLADQGYYTIYAKDPTELAENLDHDLRDACVFVQLLEEATSADPLATRQHEAAMARSIPTFRYQKSDRNRQNHANLDQDVITGGFEDFKVYLERELENHWNGAPLEHRTSPTIPPTPKVNELPAMPPSVQVVIRSKDPDPIWESMFELLNNQGDFLHDQLYSVSDSNCHGFLVICDGSATSDKESQRADMVKCREIQMRCSEPMGVPPVGLLYLAPPDPPPWATLLLSNPLMLVRINGEKDESGIKEFFKRVRVAYENDTP